MPSTSTLLDTSIGGTQPHKRGKVRDIYFAGDYLLIVATDRISAFDCILDTGIPDKGKILTQLSGFWFARTGHIVPNHFVTMRTSDYPPPFDAHGDRLDGRSMLVRRAKPLPIECVARGYLAGSGWKEYQADGGVCGIQLPPGLRESDRLPAPIFTPATKAEAGHDVNISEAAAARLIGDDLIATVRDLTLALYAFGAAHAESRGIIVADTKFEFGILEQNGRSEVVLIDEVLTPDSSRFWPQDEYQPGRSQPSVDKQFVRDYVESIHWNKQPPVPSLPDEIVVRTREKYIDVYRRLTGQELR